MASLVGIDISGVQPATVPGKWLFVVVKTTEGTSVVNPKAAQQWAFAHQAAYRGVYHYARPPKGGTAGAVATALAQANVFASDALARGFRKGLDLWQLDCEGALNDGVTPAAWSAYVPAFMDSVTARLGSVGFLYVGRFFEQAAFAPLVARYPWWLPDYGPNNGQLYPLAAGVNPVIHQFSSAGGLDRDVINDFARWQSLFGGSKPVPDVKVHPQYQPPLVALDQCVFQHPDRSMGINGACSAAVDGSGAVYCDPPAAFLGGMAGDPAFKGRIAAEIRRPTAEEQHDGWVNGYVIVDTAAETYHKGKPA